MHLQVKIEVTGRHIHLSQKDQDVLFGQGYELKLFKKMTQPGQFASQETVKVVGPKGEFPNVRIVGPVRPETQLDISFSDSYFLGVRSTLAFSGKLDNTAGGVIVTGPQGKVVMNRGVIVAVRHLHLDSETAKEYKLSHSQTVAVKTTGQRPVTFNDVIIYSRSGQDNNALHIDTDEANAAGITTGDLGDVLA
ncbi:phosphate propanoyltransferase [Patescibacteria group bacterium]